mmetsp:Transcript_6390/g.18824  ORF Transcript_6390/g.18824 Transcript_6390/m.18824 type:complete len:382 (-) Transcript_6390:568-1713(-)
MRNNRTFRSHVPISNLLGWEWKCTRGGVIVWLLLMMMINLWLMMRIVDAGVAAAGRRNRLALAVAVIRTHVRSLRGCVVGADDTCRRAVMATSLRLGGIGVAAFDDRLRAVLLLCQHCFRSRTMPPSRLGGNNADARTNVHTTIGDAGVGDAQLRHARDHRKCLRRTGVGVRVGLRPQLRRRCLGGLFSLAFPRHVLVGRTLHHDLDVNVSLEHRIVAVQLLMNERADLNLRMVCGGGAGLLRPRLGLHMPMAMIRREEKWNQQRLQIGQRLARINRANVQPKSVLRVLGDIDGRLVLRNEIKVLKEVIQIARLHHVVVGMVQIPRSGMALQKVLLAEVEDARSVLRATSPERPVFVDEGLRGDQVVRLRRVVGISHEAPG